jgi:hypothetical protein
MIFNKLNNWSKIGFLVGAVIISASLLRYFVTWTDYSQGFLYVLQGVWIIAFSWVYHVLKSLENKFDAFEEIVKDKLDEIQGIQEGDNNYLELDSYRNTPTKHFKAHRSKKWT